MGIRKYSGQGLQSGHIPGSINIPYASLTNSEQQTLLSKSELMMLFNKNHIKLSQPIVTTCGSGVSAAVLTLALFQAGLAEVPMYDGSWAEWGRQIDTPK
jgi:thiosulfate/3-mercaptopyruvate sulfurtransferase